jgi:hypothetical protein
LAAGIVLFKNFRNPGGARRTRGGKMENKEEEVETTM